MNNYIKLEKSNDKHNFTLYRLKKNKWIIHIIYFYYYSYW